ncbi:class I SAM-dependent methyltransferase [Luteolibacter sp. SL250]|uniref:class I SAM-dependent methyltransferase n=1 Tax=Luteolibacter sp. SL250 TaxID=2995170 RepID=UPI00226E1A23|nr:class I SAM-dependent methyltransferase [Luteolibacter sp. SL250]WAC18316.1 class I SAM-dependent methyltransferase [Luteolibacter sp. SL250]
MKLLKAYRKTSDLPLHRLLKGTAGRMLMSVRPDLSTAIKSKPFSNHPPLSGRLIRNGHFMKAVGEEDHAMIRDFLRDYWASGASDEFYEGLSHRYETLFLAYHSSIVDKTRSAMDGMRNSLRRMVEIGSGDGKILDHFRRCLPDLPEFHGVDVNLQQVENNRLIYRESGRMSFHHSDGLRWMEQNGGPGTVLVTNGGVLEYFTRPELEGLFGRMSREWGGCVVSLTESIAADHDLTREPGTYPYGWELSLSHNYIALLEEAGFTITHVNDRLTTPEEADTVGRWLQVVAVST